MKICFPVRKQNGSEYTTLDEMMGLIGREPHGSWLAGANCLWHGGIHVSAVSAPGSVLTPDNVETAVPLQCMAKGDVVAWRLNKDYLTADYNGKELRYSTTFVLVKSICKPDPEKENSWLEFYSLYMGLAPLSAFPKGKCFKAKTTVAQRKADKFESSASADGVSVVPTKSGQIKKDQRIIVLQEKQFRNGDKTQPFGLAKKLNRDGQAEGNTFWVTVMPEYMEPDGEQYLQMPVWMQKAVAHGQFDEVVKPPTTLGIEAGDAIGFLGEDIAPAGKSNVDSCHYAHIEVISTDPRMSGFLNNPAQVTHGKKYIQVLSGKSLYQKTGEGKDSTFKSMSCIVLKDGGIILPREKCNPLEDKDGKTWFEISPHSWITQADVKELHQYDLKELGFTTLEEDPSPDVSKSMSESWVKGAFDWFSKQLGQDRGIQQKQVSTFYNNLVKKIDADGDGEITGKELYNAVHHPEMGVRDIAARLIVKHDSEWFGGSSHHRWSIFFQNYDPLRIAYAKKWLDDMEWMSKVDAFKSGAPVWHFHPVAFMSALASEQDCAKLIWGKVVDQKLGAAKGCKFRKKVVQICSELWGDDDKYNYANTLMACIAAETSRQFSASVIRLAPLRDEQGNIQLNRQGRPRQSYQPVSKETIMADPSIANRNAVGLIQFTAPAVRQINISHGLNITKQSLALMDELEQLDYVKLYFTSNQSLLDRINGPDDIYLYIFCPAGVGKTDDYELYSRQKDEAERVNYYQANSSLDSTEDGNSGNNDGIIQRRELLSRLHKLIDEGKQYINDCPCNSVNEPLSISREPSGAQWVNRYPTSSDVNDLVPAFASSVQNFITAIQNAGGHVRVSATHRPSERAYLMHYAWRIAREGLASGQVPEKDGVSIDWTHRGDSTAAISAARDMVAQYGIVYRPSLTSRHIERRAIDMTITGITGNSIVKANGNSIIVRTNTELNAVGASYGVHKLISDPPHWSDDGR